MNRETFNSNLKKFVRANETSMKLALLLSQAAFVQFEQHGDLSYAQDFYDSMPKNYIRRVAFVKWMKDFSPFTMDGNHMRKDKSPSARPFDKDGAFAKPFWEYAPEKEQVLFGEDDIVISMERALKKFESDKAKAKSAKAQMMLKQAKQAIDTLKRSKEAVMLANEAPATPAPRSRRQRAAA